MILDSLLAMLLSGILTNIDAAVPPEWILDSVVVTVSYEVAILSDGVNDPYVEASPGIPAVSRAFGRDAQHPWLVTSQPLDSWRLHQQWGFESQIGGPAGVYSFSRHPLWSGWDLRLAFVHESVPSHSQEARWGFAHGVF